MTFLILALVAGLTAGDQAAPQTPPPAPSPSRAIAAVLPSLVRISVVYLDQQAGREIKGMLSGSGTIISADGYVVTNHHVAGRPRRIVCTLSNKEEVPADLIGTDPMSDIAVLKLRPEKPRTFPAAHFGDSDLLQRGQIVLAMGSPLALSQSVTQGIVSNKEMIMPQSGGADLLDGEDVGAIVKWIGHDAAIYPGNSGGPLVNLAGEIVGVNEISYGLGGAIPANLAKSVVAALIKDGHVRRSWTGIELQPRIGDSAKNGALVAWVADKSPASAAGLKSGDLLLKVGEKPTDVRYGEQLPGANGTLLGLPVGQAVKVTVMRDGKELTLAMTPVERTAAESVPAELQSWGMTGANITDLEAREMLRPNTEGVRVVSLRPSGPADQAKPALRPNDVIVDVEGHAVKTVAELDEQTRAALGTKGRVKLLVTFDRDRDRYLTVVEVGTLASDDPPREAKKAWVPVDVQVLTPPLAERLGLKGKTGVRVTRLLDAKTPLKVGDIILAVDGDPVRASVANEEDLFSTMIRRLKVGSTATLTINRNGSEMPLPVTLVETQTQSREMKRYSDTLFEFRARDLAEADRTDPELQDVTGVLVESVAARGWASLARLNGGDVIMAIDGKPVKNVDELQARLADIQSRKPASVVFQIRRGIRTMFIEIQPAWK